MKKITKLLKSYMTRGILLGGLVFSTTINAQDNEFFYGDSFKAEPAGHQTTDLAEIIKEDSIDKNDGKEKPLFYKIREYFRLTGTEYDTDQPAIAYVKMILNMALGLTSFISLILIIFAFYLMFFQKQEEGFTKAKKILTGVAIALVLMGLSWIIVSSIFRIYKAQVKTTTTISTITNTLAS